MSEKLEMPLEQFAEAVSKENNRLHEEIERLKAKCDTQTMILRRLTPDRFPDTYFIHSGVGEKDQNGMPQKLLVCPAYGVDFSYVYEYNGKTTGPEW